ncbi:MAG TPA: glycosyltransferase family 39 protein, partial [Candidatus Acidoferrales bacterium]|nr:glycosyltransferase family 39 protein [Candidatus Acidoferrales bacterium]
MLDSGDFLEAEAGGSMQGPGGFRNRGSADYAVNLATIAWTLLIALVFYICFFSHLATLGLVGPDEPRYASVARTMAESGDWVTPRLNGQPWFEKPVLYYWCAAAALHAFPTSELAARLPSALAAALAALGLGWIAWRSYGYEAARAVLLIFPTCIGVCGFARAATPDMLFSAALTGVMLAGYHAQAQERGSIAARGAFGAFLGAATLAKGPAAIALAAGSMALWALGTRRWRDVYRLAHPLALAAFCLVALPWYMLCAARNPDFVRTFLFEHNFERYLTPIFRHEQPFWFFGPVLLLGLLPWTVLLAGAARDAARLWNERAWAGSPGFFFACWAIFPVVFFSFSKSKLPGYVLPALPPLALLVVRSMHSLEENERFARLLVALVGGTFVALAASAGYWLRRLPKESGLADPHRALLWIVLVAAGGVTTALLGARRPAAGALAAALLMAGLVEGLNRNVLQQLDAHLSPRAAARAGRSHAAADPISVYRVHRAWRYGLNFYLRRELRDWTPQSTRPGWVYTSAAGL